MKRKFIQFSDAVVNKDHVAFIYRTKVGVLRDELVYRIVMQLSSNLLTEEFMCCEERDLRFNDLEAELLLGK